MQVLSLPHYLMTTQHQREDIPRHHKTFPSLFLLWTVDCPTTHARAKADLPGRKQHTRLKWFSEGFELLYLIIKFWAHSTEGTVSASRLMTSVVGHHHLLRRSREVFGLWRSLCVKLRGGRWTTALKHWSTSQKEWVKPHKYEKGVFQEVVTKLLLKTNLLRKSKSSRPSHHKHKVKNTHQQKRVQQQRKKWIKYYENRD